jgi:regulator of sirC expression with transglutaminase-like and TPR domain
MVRIITRTLAEIYLQQGHLQEAYEIFKAIAEKDPTDMEIQRRVKELEEKLYPSPLSREEKIRHLEKWLANIRKQKAS